MNLIRLSPQLLEPYNALPFDVYDARGRLLLAAGRGIDEATRAHLQRWELYADAAQSRVWRERVALARWRARQGRHATPAESAPAVRAEPPRLSLAQEWTMLAMALESALREPLPDGAWVREAQAVRRRARAVAAQASDASLCHLIYTAGLHTNLYSCHQALRRMLVAGGCARVLGWSEAQVASLECAALTMNVALRQLQDMLTQRDTGLSAGLRQQVVQNPRDGARLLAAAGVADPVWLGAVLLHREAPRAVQPLATLPPAQQAAWLLRRVDVLCAKLSRRGRRTPLSGLQAMREACAGADAPSDEIGAALLQTLGLYPPGTFVRLHGGETALVLARGSRANAPLAGAFADADGLPLPAPRLRDTAQPEHAVAGAPDTARVLVRPNHEKLLALLR